MSCKKCKSSPCGCKDTALPMAPLCTTAECPQPAQCPEVWDACCVIYTGDTIVDLDINPGDKVCEILQKLILNGLNPGCVDPTSTCQSVLNLFSYNITDVGLEVQWTGVSTATSYIVEYKEATSLVWILNPAVLPPVDHNAITGLQPSTDYHVRVNAICASGNCYSLTIQVTTKST